MRAKPNRRAAKLPGALSRTSPERVGLSGERLERIGQTLQRDIAQGKLPGAVALVARHGKVAYWEAFGSRTPGGPAMERDDVFRIASMTKPIVSVAVMMLAEEGRFVLSDPISKFIPSLARLQVAVPRGGQLDLEPARAEITLQDLLRHTSGLTYSFRLNHLQMLYADAQKDFLGMSNAEVIEALAKLPLAFHPGTVWEYSHSTSVLGYLVEVISGLPLGEFLRERVLGPLGMHETGFHVPEAKWHRLAEAGPDPASGQSMPLRPVKYKPKFEEGGGGLVSTAGDYVRFAQMLLNGGELEGVRLLGPKTVGWMTSDHLGPIPRNPVFYPGPGHGFGLGFAVRTSAGVSPYAGSVGEYSWTGSAGTAFWVDPQEQLIGLLMVQLPQVLPLLMEYWIKIRNPVLQAIVE